MRRFLIKLTYTVLPIWLVAVISVTVFSLIICPKFSGDIGRLALIPFGQEYDIELESKNPMPDRIFPIVDRVSDLKGTKSDVVTVGDSFSERGHSGYQNYLSAHGLKVVNCNRRLYYNPATFAYQIMDLGYIDSTSTSVLVVEIVERSLEYFMTDFNPHAKMSTKTSASRRMGGSSSGNQWSLARFRDYILMETGYADRPTLQANLDRDFFSSNEPSSLHFYKDDIMACSIQDEQAIRAAYATLLEKARQCHIRLIMMVAVNKYDLYQRHIVNNPWKANRVNDDLNRMFGQDTHWLLTDQCLEPLVEQGEKDLFLYNDTHWSYRAAKVVGDKLYEVIEAGAGR